jgi:hypothetical protein
MRYSSVLCFSETEAPTPVIESAPAPRPPKSPDETVHESDEETIPALSLYYNGMAVFLSRFAPATPTIARDIGS